MKRKVYVDHAATTFLNKDVVGEIEKFEIEHAGNPNSLHAFGRDALKGVLHGRTQVAKSLNAKESEIYFTSCGTEADNWAIKGYAFAHMNEGKHIITSSIEHPAVLNSCKQLEKFGFRVTFLPVDKDGFVLPSDLENAICDDTILVSIMFANNEIGTIQPVKKLAEIAHQHGVAFHTDAVQACGSCKIDVEDLGVDMLSISGHKFYAPKGIGVLFVKDKIKIESLLSGGEQERGKRGGTTNVCGVVGIGKAIEMASQNMKENGLFVEGLRNDFLKKVFQNIDGVFLNGTTVFSKRLQNNANLRFENVNGEALLCLMDIDGICASSGSACSTGSTVVSDTLKAIGLSEDEAKSSIRFSFGLDNSKEDVDYIVECLKKNVEKLRENQNLFLMSQSSNTIV